MARNRELPAQRADDRVGHAMARLRAALAAEVIPVSLEIDFAEGRYCARV
ncbi:hypothetical protein [Nocardia salmonicida]